MITFTKRSGGFLLAGWLAATGTSPAVAQESTVYATVVSTKLFVVGGANPQTGLFFQKPSADTVWDHTGPVNIRAFCCAVHPGTGGKTMYIAAGNGVHRSTDGGATWKITTSWRMTEVLWVAPDPKDANTVYAASSYGIAGTSDGGATWRELNAGLEGKFSPCVIMDAEDSRVLYCATEQGAFRSSDRGEHWTKMALHVPGIRTLAQHPRTPKLLFAGTEDHGIYVSRNGGEWWEKCEGGLEHRTFYAITFDPAATGTVYAAGYKTGVYKSVDGGQRWQQVNDGLGDPTIHTLAVDPRKGERVYAGTHGGGIYRTDNGGTRWRHVGRSDSQVWHMEIPR